ncbi:thioredoxin family protein [Fodinisporobacter ferrooxydans]|uniref:Thioredoxin n=1 Tax=Fodinisporobacter ferrooxydans TaxID=2901836 RepID=A0ABY4CFE8_9BACL|nr:thioredoxin family protein [Alicyclobacillaceae bacterium MYW30-H2]
MIEINKENFTTEVIESDKPVLIDIWGPSCQPCLALMPQVERLSETYSDKVKMVKLNSVQNRRLCIDIRVIGLPSFLLYKDGVEVSRLSSKDITIQDIENLIVAYA